MVVPAIDCMYMHFLSPATYPNVLDTTIRDSNLRISIGHRIMYHDKTTIATEVPMVPSPLDEYIVHVFDTMGHMTTMIAYKPRTLVITYQIGWW